MGLNLESACASIGWYCSGLWIFYILVNNVLMSVPKKLLKYLERENVEYGIISHKPAYTALDLSRVIESGVGCIVKTLVLRVRKRVTILALVSSGCRVDKKKLGNIIYNEVASIRKKQFHAKRGEFVVPTEWGFPQQELRGKAYGVEMAPKKWINEKLLGNIGATPPFGRLLRLPVIMDKELTRQEKLILNSGDYSTSIVMNTDEFMSLERPMVGCFSVSD